MNTRAATTIAPERTPSKKDADRDSLTHLICHCQVPLPGPLKRAWCGQLGFGPTMPAGTAPKKDVCVVCVDLVKNSSCKHCGRTPGAEK